MLDSRLAAFCKMAVLADALVDAEDALEAAKANAPCDEAANEEADGPSYVAPLTPRNAEVESHRTDSARQRKAFPAELSQRRALEAAEALAAGAAPETATPSAAGEAAGPGRRRRAKQGHAAPRANPTAQRKPPAAAEGVQPHTPPVAAECEQTNSRRAAAAQAKPACGAPKRRA